MFGYELMCLLLAVQCQFVLLTPLLVATFFQENNSTALLSAAQHSVDMINSRGDMLPSNYTLSLLTGDSDTIENTVVSYMRNVAYSDEEAGCLVGMIGPDNDQDSIETLSSLANRHRVGTPHIHFSTLPLFQNRDMYVNSFGILGSQLDLIDAVISMVRHQNWNEILIFYEEDNKLFRQAIEYFTALLTERISIKPIQKSYILFDEKNISRVVIVMARAPLVCEVLLNAVNKRITYPVFQIIVIGLKYDQLYNECRFNSLSSVVFNQLLLVTFTFNVDDKQQWNTDISYSHNHLLVGDSIQALVLAINQTLKTNISCRDEYFNSMVSSNLANVKFKGSSGSIYFNSATGYNVRTVDIFQAYDSTVKQIGHFNNGSLVLLNGNFLINTSLGRELDSVRVEVASFFTLPTMIQFCIIVTLHILTVVYRKHKSIRASNPKLSHSVFVGCYLTIVTLMLYLWPYKTVPIVEGRREICMAFNYWLLPFSLTLVFGPLIAHIWRLYRIFTHFNRPGCCLSDNALYSIVVLMICVDLLIAILNTTIGSTQVSYTFTDKVSPEGKVIESPMCRPTSFLVLIWVYKYLQAVSLLILSCLTSNNKMNRDFSTSRFKTATYSMIVSSVILFTLYISFWITDADIHADVIIMCIIANSFLLLCTVFILLPPVAGVLRAQKRINTYSSAVFL